MEKTPKIRIVRIVELVAEELEREAELMPPEHENAARILRAHAKILRKSKDQRILRVWEGI